MKLAYDPGWIIIYEDGWLQLSASIDGRCIKLAIQSNPADVPPSNRVWVETVEFNAKRIPSLRAALERLAEVMLAKECKEANRNGNSLADEFEEFHREAEKKRRSHDNT